MAKKILIIKLTSMGDLMHAFPALSEASYVPDLTFDWVVDQHFADVPSWHPNVRNIHRTNHRIWKKQPWARSTSGRVLWPPPYAKRITTMSLIYRAI